MAIPVSAFFADLVDEFLARRTRLRAAYGDRAATLIEFVLVSGLALGAFAMAFGIWWGLAPLAAALAGYALLDRNRQRALAAGADAFGVRRRQDRLALLLFAAMAVCGAAVFALALTRDEARRAAEEAAREAARDTPGLYEVEIGP